jgi:ADP-heptose:LPS heptosyltransferase
MGGQPRLAVLRALGLGDLLTSVPALRALARAFPEHRRLLLGPRWLEPLLPLIVEEGRPCLADLIETGGLGAGPPALPAAEIAVNLHGRGPESHRLLLATKPGRLLAFGHREVPESAGMPPWRADEHEVARWCRMLRESGIAADPEQLGIRRPEAAAPAWARGATVLHPGAASAARRWPAGRWAALARAEREAGRSVLVTGSRAEAGLARTIVREAELDPSCAIAGSPGLLDLAALVAVAGVVVCGDTGIAHLATALGVRSVLLFGPTPPRLWGPPPERRRHRVLWAGRSGDPHAATPDPGLLAIEAGTVIASVEELRSASRSREERGEVLL